MRWPIILVALGLASMAHSGGARPVAPKPVAQTPVTQTMATDLATLADAAKFKGSLLIADRNNVLAETSVGTTKVALDRRFAKNDRWPWASVTKQVVATMIMQQVSKGRIDLDARAIAYLPALGTRPVPPTVRQLLQHRAGLRNPNDSPADARGTPSFYWDGPTGLDWCLAGRGESGGNWQYNNCDYIVLGAVLEQVTGQRFTQLFAKQIAQPAGLKTTALQRDETLRAMVPAAPAYAKGLLRYGASGALVGSARDMLAFDRALLAGKLLPDAQRDEMWRGDPALGYMALGQWAFTVPIAGCAKPVRIIERRGGIGDFQARNLILPDLGLFIIAFTDRGETEFDFGEIWMGKGFSHDLLKRVACTKGKK